MTTCAAEKALGVFGYPEWQAIVHNALEKERVKGGTF